MTPAAHGTAVLTKTDMPYAGPRTPNNLRLLLICAIACVSLLRIAAALRYRRKKQPDQA
jgi:hypothetical protein